MQFNTERATLYLEPRDLLRLRGARGLRIACHAGMLWLTQEGVARDDFLGPGAARVVETRGTVLIEAMAASRASLDTAAARALDVCEWNASKPALRVVSPRT